MNSEIKQKASFDTDDSEKPKQRPQSEDVPDMPSGQAPYPKGAGGKQNKAPSIKKIAAIAAAATALLIGATYWYVSIQIPINEATDKFAIAVAALEARNAELDKAIFSLRETLKSGEKPLDPATADNASSEIGLAQGERQTAPDCPRNVEEIESAIKKLERMGQYSDRIASLQAAQSELEKSIRQLKRSPHLKNPSSLNELKASRLSLGLKQ